MKSPRDQRFLYISMSGAKHYVLDCPLLALPASSFRRPEPYGSTIHVQGALILSPAAISAWVICENHATLGEKQEHRVDVANYIGLGRW
ncbi:hypothetical protein GQ55_8G208400 [Panicum hallii var. hallii]|uniref:Uncharacterized protein n=1 Tax=Panicum hallii var. hallii TaxID=1504633 RepID=A0A2T7CPJ7_9POAL|nr:hypothetical protein GQ55_8G208400 [Panicum hallii var. hallii]